MRPHHVGPSFAKLGEILVNKTLPVPFTPFNNSLGFLIGAFLLEDLGVSQPQPLSDSTISHISWLPEYFNLGAMPDAMPTTSRSLAHD